jgi:hypothetical protein
MWFLRSTLAVVVVVVTVSCGGKPSPSAPVQGALSSRWSAPSILAGVPADSPYVVALIDPISEALQKRMMARLDAQLSQSLQKLERLKVDRSKLDPWMRAVLALGDELRGSKPSQWFDKFGINQRGRFVIYGLSLWPVIRVEVTDAAQLRKLIERLLTAAGFGIQERTLGGRAYWLAAGRDFSFVAAVLDREAVAALVPTAALDAALPLVLGTRAPDHPLSATSTVPELLARHHFLGALVAYFDLPNLIALMTRPQPGPLDIPLRAATGPISPVCRGELDRLAAVMPRVVLGYHHISDDRFDGSFVFELQPSVISALRKLRTAVPEVSAKTTGHPLVAFGVAADPDAVVAWLREVTGQLHAHPFSCPWFDGITKASNELAGKLDTPLPPTWRGVRGFALTVDDASASPPSVNGHLVIAGDRVADLVASLAGSVPAVAGIPLTRDGRPIALPLQKLGLPVSSAHLALTTDRLVIAAGEGSERRATEHLSTPAPRVSPLMTIAFNAPRLKQLLASLGQAPGDSLDALDDVGFVLDIGDQGLEMRVWGTETAAPIAAPPAKP